MHDRFFVFFLEHILAWKAFLELSSGVLNYCGGVECTQQDVEHCPCF